MARIVGLLIEGFGTRLLAAGAALAVGLTASDYIAGLFQGVNDALVVLP